LRGGIPLGYIKGFVPAVLNLGLLLIQNMQNRDARAINHKLNEWIHAIDAADDQMMTSKS
jgi:low affinity Fe/Cu permease